MRGLVGNISKICLVFVQELSLTFNLCNFALGFLCMFFFFFTFFVQTFLLVIAQTLPPPLSKKQKGHPGIVLRVNLLKYERFVESKGGPPSPRALLH